MQPEKIPVLSIVLFTYILSLANAYLAIQKLITAFLGKNVIKFCARPARLVSHAGTNKASACLLVLEMLTHPLYNIAIATGYLDNVVHSCHNLTAVTDSFIVIECHLSYHLKQPHNYAAAITTTVATIMQ